MKTYKNYSTRKTSQKEKIPGSDQVENNAGGFAWAVDDWARLDRFLILGSEGGTYYVKEQKLTKENAECVIRCIKEDGVRVINKVVEVSQGGQAPKNDPALFVLAMCAGLGDKETKKKALEVLPKVARIGTHLFHFAEYVQQFRGWGRGLREGIANWYAQPAQNVAYQAVKYQQRDGWTHRDLLRLSHAVPHTATHNKLFGWITQDKAPGRSKALAIVRAYKKAQKAKTDTEIVELIETEGLTREMIPTEFLKSTKVWDALLQKMPMTATIRNLGKMSTVGLLDPLSDSARLVCDRLRNDEQIQKSRVHPLQILVAMKTFEQGHGVRGKLSWAPNAKIVDALDNAFYTAFDNVEPTNKRIALALDVSASMDWESIAGMPGITPRIGSAAMAMVTARVEPQHFFMAFSQQLVNVSISPRQRLDDVCKQIANIPMGGTDCALPMLGAMEHNLPIDKFVIYTDSETWAGSIHPVQALQEYREKMGINAKLIIVGMVSNGFTIADPHDPGMLDVVGFNTATPQVISQF